MPGIGEIQGTVSNTLSDRDRNGEEKQLDGRAQRLSKDGKNKASHPAM